jgi:hypothetical protein
MGIAFTLNSLLLRQALLESAPPPKARAGTAGHGARRSVRAAAESAAAVPHHLAELATADLHRQPAPA